MRYWLVAFATALVVIVGNASGLLGLLIAAIAFCVALFLLWAEQLGLVGAWTAFGLDRLEAATAAPPTREQLVAFIQDRDKVVKAASIALILTALSLILPEEYILIGVLVAVGWTALRIRNRRSASPMATAVRQPPSPRFDLPAATPAPLIQSPQPLSGLIDHQIPAVVARPATSTVVPAPADFTKAAPLTVPTMLAASTRAGRLSSTSTLALLARGGRRMQRIRRSSKRPKRAAKSRGSRKATRHVPLHLKLPLGRRQIRRPKRPLRSGPKLMARSTTKMK